MEISSNIVLGILAVLLIAFVYYLFTNRSKEPEGKEAANSATRQMQLAAYERLILLVDRISLPNLISRLNQPGATAKEMQHLLVQSIKQEYEYNISQQIYVSADAWGAIKNLKEQNILVINQFANTLPPQATGLDLNKFLLEYLMNDKKGALHEVVSEVLSYEAKKLL
ncbi:hypothetical protein FC093_19920 [Ilyomonas limi]|uniref:Uncharacterized protein n=1 Tax=Ilyomonas limi TaxID=2575867 RepID=A0A4U3KWY7_9BACT|nr:hypothetical protein [Ilyomonas limi]TKK65587.1 hypothetical protein FC093_19920 [Ilyomonas limi]